MTNHGLLIAGTCAAFVLASPAAHARDNTRPSQLGSARTVDLALTDNDVIPTGNDWIALPSIRASDGALQNFNLISMRYRGLLEVAGVADRPLMAPFVEVAGMRRPLAHLHWSLRDYWIPTGTMETDGVRLRLTYVAPPASHAAIMRFQLTNLRATPVRVSPGMALDWGRTNRVTYSPELLSGSRTMSPTPIDTDMEIFKYNTDDTQMAWGFAYVGSQGKLHTGTADPGLTASHDAQLAPGQTLDVHFLIGVGVDEYSAAYAMRVLNKRIDRYTLDGVIDQAADDAHRRTRTTGNADLDRIMNRNLLFTTYYGWHQGFAGLATNLPFRTNSKFGLAEWSKVGVQTAMSPGEKGSVCPALA